jgi:hypothetical protein
MEVKVRQDALLEAENPSIVTGQCYRGREYILVVSIAGQGMLVSIARQSGTRCKLFPLSHPGCPG